MFSRIEPLVKGLRTAFAPAAKNQTRPQRRAPEPAQRNRQPPPAFENEEAAIPDDWKAAYPSLERFAKDVGLAPEKLVASYLLEREFHTAVLQEPRFATRRQMYDDIYTRVFEIYGSTFAIDVEAASTPRDALVDMLAPELSGRAILDVGCGAGQFLVSCARRANPTRLLGLDVFAKDLDAPQHRLAFRRSDIIRFSVDEPFDVAITDNVIEHIAPQDVAEHLASIAAALKPDGTLIILTPHRDFGPWDVTRILDDSYSGRIAAQGTHLKEYTYAEMADLLHAAGFADLQTLHPKTRLGLRPPHARMDLALFLRGEKRESLMRKLQAMDKRHRYTAFEMTFIARKRAS